MKTKNTLQKLPDINLSMSEHRRISLALVSAIIMTLLALSGNAANILVNPGFESSPIFTSGSWSQHASETWSMASAGSADPTTIKLVHTGANGLWMQGLYGNGQNGPQTSYAAQDATCLPGNTYTADAWFSTYAVCTKHIGGDDGSLNYTTYTTNGVTITTNNFQGGSSFYTADASPPGEEDGWVEVMFFNSGNVLLADYKSQIITPAFIGTTADTAPNNTTYTPGTGNIPLVTNALGNIYLAWTDCPVTNQYDITTVTANTDPAVAGGVTNTLGAGQFITAPPGAVKVEFRINLFQFAFEAGAPFWDDATLNQVGGPSPSVIGNLSPSGTNFFSGGSNNFTFNVTSAASGGAPLPTNSTSSISIIVNGKNQTANLQFSGPSTNLSVTLPGLTSNSLYSITVNVTNSVGLTSAKSVNFDTFPANVFIVSAEDYDYTNGQFFDNPTPTAAPAANSYYGTGGVLGADISTYNGTGTLPGNGAAQLIRSDNHTAMQKADDIQLPLYAAQNNANVYNVQIAYNNGGNWLDYTRDYPTGNCLVYLRYNDNTPGNFESLNLITSGAGTTAQSSNILGNFISAGIGANYGWTPLIDTNGNKAIVNLPAGQNTLQLLSGGLANFVDFIFIPIGTGFPLYANLSPNNINPPINTNIFLSVTDITYTVSSSSSTIATNNIHTLINGVDVSASATYSGNSSSWNVSVPCPQNELITLVLTATDANGGSNSITETFDTFTQNNLMIEGVDFDFNGGQFIDNSVPTAPYTTATNSYYNAGVFGTNVAYTNIDYSGGVIDGGEAWPYRNLDQQAGGQETDTDFLRDKFTNDTVEAASGGLPAEDYDLGFWNPGFWENYTRTFPAGNYNVIARMAGGAGPFSGMTLKLVTAGQGTTNQTTQLLGSFGDASAAGWNVWHWVPMRDASGNLATISLSGVQTVRATSAGGANLNYLMFVPAVSLSPTLTISRTGSSISLQFPTAIAHNYTVLFNTTLNGGTWQPLAAVISGDGTIKTVGDTAAGPAKFYRLQIQ